MPDMLRYTEPNFIFLPNRIRSDLLCILRLSPTPMPTTIVRRRRAVSSEQVRIKARNPMFPGNHLTMWHAGFGIAMLTLFDGASLTACSLRDSRLAISDNDRLAGLLIAHLSTIQLEIGAAREPTTSFGISSLDFIKGADFIPIKISILM